MQNLGTIDNIYTILEIKGRDKSSSIFTVKHNQTEVKYLIEVFNRDVSLKEIKILEKISTINNPYILHYISHGSGTITLPEKTLEKKIYIVYEYANHSSLLSYISHKKQGFPEKYAKLIFKKILEGIKALHDANICHRDPIPDNIIFDENYNPKICEFSLSCINDDNLKEFVGNIQYVSPQIFLKMPYSGIKNDIFILGGLLFNLVTNLQGFKSSKEDDNYYKLIKEKKNEEYWAQEAFANLNLSQSFKNLFLKMVAFNPDERPTIEQILNDEWLQEINNLNEEEKNTLENELKEEFLKLEQMFKAL